MSEKTIEVLRPSENYEPVKVNDRKIRVAAYCRISDISDETHMNSLENQMDYYSKYILKHPEYKLVGIYYDSGISGITIDQRPGFKRLIRHCKEHRIDIVITKSISRFSRNSEDLLETVELLKANQVTVIFEKEKIDTMKMRNKFFLTALSAVYQQESRTTSEHVKWGNEKRNKMGKPIFRDQFGYRVVKIDGEVTFDIVEEETDVIKQVYNWFLEGKSTVKIAYLLTENGIKTPRGNDIWSNISIRNILSNVNYTGSRYTNKFVSLLLEKRYIKNEGIENRYYIKNTHPAIIDEDTFNKAQSMIEKNKRDGSSGSSAYPLTKRIKCAYCGWTFYHSKKRSIHRWKCGLKSNHSNLCDSSSITETQIIEMMKKALHIRYDFDKPGTLKRMKEELERVNQNDRFELHRMSHLMRLILAKEELAAADEDLHETLRKQVADIESEILAFEDLASKIEEDRVYRLNSLVILNKIKSLDEFLDKSDVSILRAWIMEITVLTKDDFQVRWLDNEVTELGDFLLHEDRRNKRPDKSKKMKAGIKISDEMKNKANSSGKVDKQIQEKGDGEVEVLEIQNKPNIDLIQQIKKKYRDSSQNVLIIEPTKKKRKTRVGVYARVSTREADQLGSLEAQIAYYTFSILKDPNNQLIRVYADEGVSGTNAEKRSGFQKMIKDCENGKIDRIVTKSISRFARNTVDALDYVRKLKEFNVSIYFEKEEIDTADEEGEVLLTVYSALAQEESRSLGESVSWGKKALAKRGVVKHSMRTYGYKINKDSSWSIVEEEATVVRSIYERFVSGVSGNQISKELTLEGIPTMKKRPSWQSTTISAILNNPSYTGDLLYQKRYTKDTFTSRSKLNFGDVSKILIEDHHPAIIDRDTWDAAQSILSKRKRTISKIMHERTELFTKLICAECGSILYHSVRRNQNSERHKWRCKAAQYKDPLIDCNASYLVEPDILDSFMKMLLECKSDRGLELLIDENLKQKRLTQKDKNRLLYLEDEIQKRYQELYRVVEKGGKIGEDTTEIKRHTNGIMEIQDEINELIDNEDEYQFLMDEKKWFIKELEDLPAKGDLSYRDDIFKRVVQNGVVLSNKSITFNLIFGISRKVNISNE